MELSDLQFAVYQQHKIDEYDRAVDNIVNTLLDYDSTTIKHSDDSRIELIHNTILEYKKELLKTESGREFLDNYNIDLFKDK